jgi:hypothetical protein
MVVPSSDRRNKTSCLKVRRHGQVNERNKETKKEVNTPGLGLSQHLSVLQTGGTEKGGRTYVYAEQHRHTQLEHYMFTQLRAAHAQPAGTAHAQPA